MKAGPGSIGWRLTLVVGIAGLAAVAGCGDDQSPATDVEGQGGSATPAPLGAESCERVAVPGHEGVDIRVRGVTCDRAAQVIAGAVGQGRRPYEAAGFFCRPAAAGAGDTDYTCTRERARITFHYGAA